MRARLFGKMVEFNRRKTAVVAMLVAAAVLVIVTVSAPSTKGDPVVTRAGRSILSGCPEYIVGRNYNHDNAGPRVLLSSGAYNNIVDGVSKTLNRLVDDLLERGFQVLVLAPVAPKPAMEHAGLLYPAHSMSVPFRPEYQLALGLDQCTLHVLDEFDPDIVQIATPDYLGTKIQNWAIAHNKPVVCSYHTRFNSYLPYYIGTGHFLQSIDAALWSWMRTFYNKCLHTYPPTPSVAEELRDHDIESDMRIWPRGIDLTLFNPSRRSAAMRKEWGVEDDTPVILIVCRLVWEKNLEAAVDTLELLAKYKEKFRAVIVGQGPAAPSLQARFPDAIFPGFLAGEDLAIAFASADIFFFPSLTETWGAVTLEALASGLPVVVANAPGSKELVENGKTGFLVKDGDAVRWANALTELMHNPALRQQFSHQALTTVSDQERFSWSRATNMIISHYKLALGDRGAAKYATYLEPRPVDAPSGRAQP